MTSAYDVENTVALHARALADPTRRRIFRTIADADSPLDVSTLTALIDLHHTTVRSHLTVLRDAGLITEKPEERRRPGRPRLLYELAPNAGDVWKTPDAYRRLAALLARVVSTGSTAVDVGRSAARVERSRLSDDSLAALVEAVASEGFDPIVESRSEQSAIVTLRRCPFADVAALDPATVCGLHRGLAEGLAEEIGGLTIDHLTQTDPHVAGCSLKVSIEDNNKRSKQ